ncbi:hypothetical protein [Pseudomonas sp. Ant30-3]|uniref:hypothetical protein n=1 Tax=Pseudomonas sp. Ant30-3 TaxID=1488328 RepID=UPI00048ABB0B|nr:hypothetical protein [Pseudomonas sp. Ant30-3]
MKKYMCWLGLLAVLFASPAYAVNQEIRALFRPDPAQPNKNVFVNQTPNSGYCAEYPGECASNGMFSIQLPLRFTSSRPLNLGAGVYILVPVSWRSLTVTNVETLKTETVEVRFVGVGSKYILSHTAASLTGAANDREAHQKLWVGSSWNYAPAPCQYSGVGAFGADTYRFFWKTPQHAHCGKQNYVTIPGITFENLDFAYELRTPNPLGMRNGLYKGSLTYSVAHGGDIDLGPALVPSDSSLTLDFVLEVQHTLKVELPPGGNRVVLEPAGGWQPWIEGGRKPDRIYRAAPFYISASTPFKVSMLCDAASSSRCNLRSPSGNVTQVGVKIRMPPGFGLPDDYEQPLALHAWFNYWPSQYVDRQEGAVIFEMPKDVIDKLLVPGFSDTFYGDITIIWDSEA